MIPAKYKNIYICEDCVGKYSRLIVANGYYEARKIFAKLHGFYAVDCFVKRLARLPAQLQGQNINPLPDDKLVNSCGILIIDVTKCTADPVELKIISIAKRVFKDRSKRIIYCKELKNRFVFQEKI